MSDAETFDFEWLGAPPKVKEHIESVLSGTISADTIEGGLSVLDTLFLLQDCLTVDSDCLLQDLLTVDSDFRLAIRLTVDSDL